MKFVRSAIRKALAAVGYELHRRSERRLRLDTFANLAQAYEHRLQKDGAQVPSNERRPELLSRLGGTPPSEAYFIIRALADCDCVDGDTCEFGVAQGETSALIANELLSGDKVLHLFDSFQGLPSPTDKDKLKDDISSLGSIEAYAGEMSCPEEMVHARLKAGSFPADRYVIHRGFADNTLKDNPHLPARVNFAYVDFDFYEPTKLVLEFLRQTGSQGSVIIVDDYDYFSTGVKTAVDEFLENAGPGEYECSVPDTEYGHFAVLTRKAVS